MESTQWEETQDNFKLTMLRNLYGVHAPARLAMERKIVAAVSPRDHDAISADGSACAQNPHMPGMGRSNIHLDILMGRDETLDPADFFLGWSAFRPASTLLISGLGMEQGLPQNLHSDMERKVGL